MIPKQAQGLLDILHAFKDVNMFWEIGQFKQHEFRCILYNHFKGTAQCILYIESFSSREDLLNISPITSHYPLPPSSAFWTTPLLFRQIESCQIELGKNDNIDDCKEEVGLK